MNYYATFSNNTFKEYKNMSYNIAFTFACQWANDWTINLETLEQV